MTARPPRITSSGLYPTLSEAQQAALPGLARDLAAAVQALLAAGVLCQLEDGRIIPTPKG